jgi:isopenicillin-N N-acyltransferase-like protein
VRTFTTSATDPYARGRELGAGCADEIRTTLAAYRRLWAAFGVRDDEILAVGTAVLDPTATFAPDLRAEMAGLAAGSGLAENEVGALNARTELLALGDQRLVAAGKLPGEGLSECSLAVRLDTPATTGRSAGPLTAQTWDWHTPLADSWFCWTLRRADGRQVSTLTEYGIVGKIGVGCPGVGAVSGAAEVGAAEVGAAEVGSAVSVHFNAMRHVADTGTGGVPVHVVARRILDEASDVASAVALAAEADVSASAAVTVTGKPGDGDGGWSSCTIELRPGGPSLVRARDGWLAHANHFVADDVTQEEQVASVVSTTHERLDRVCAVAAGDPPPADREAAAARLATHDLGPRSVCVHGFPDAPVGQRSATLAVVVTEPADGRMHVHAGRPCQVDADGWWTSP